MLELRENGDLARWEKYWFDKGECLHQSSGKDGAQSALTLDNIAGIFYILIGGLVTAIISAAIEFFYKSRIDAKKSQVRI